jgi:hypothetical protein
MDQSDFPKMDKTSFTVSSLFDESDEKAYWLSRTPQERLQHLEILRQINYGYTTAERLQRVFEITQRTES